MNDHLFVVIAIIFAAILSLGRPVFCVRGLVVVRI